MSNDSQPVPITLGEKQPIACTLTDTEAATQVMEWSDLRGQVLRRRSVPGGMVVNFPAGLEDTVRDLAAREGQCCAFLTLTVSSRHADEIELSVTSANPEAQPIIDLLVGAEASSSE